MSKAWSEPAIVIVIGIQAAGKSTIGRLLAESLVRAAFVDGDDVARMVVRGRVGMTPDASAEAVSQLHLRNDQAARLAESFHGHGFAAVWSDNIYGPDLRRLVDQVCATPVIVVALSPNDEAVIAREVARGFGAYRHWMRESDLHAAVAEFQGYLAETPKLGLWLDTSEQSPQETVATVLARAWTEGRVR